MNKTTVHIRKKYASKTPNDQRVTLCGEKLFVTGTAAYHSFLVHSVTLRDAEIMDGTVRTKAGKRPSNVRRSYVLPPIDGPASRDLIIPEIDWCEDCFDHPSRALKLLAQTDL